MICNEGTTVTKEELIYLTLRQLRNSLSASPENFRLEDTEIGFTNSSFTSPTIIWQFKIKLKENEYVQDPLNPTRTIIVTYNRIKRELSCNVYFREVNSINYAITPETQAAFKCCQLPILNRSYRQFMHIRKILIKQKRDKDFVNYMQKLNNIFPSIHEDELFK